MDSVGDSSTSGVATTQEDDEITRRIMTSQTAAAHDRGATSEDTSDGSAGDDDRDDVSVTMIATPGDASCGIGTYARDLMDAFDGADVFGRATGDSGDATTSESGSGAATASESGSGTATATSDAIDLEQDHPTAGHFLTVALRAAGRGSDVVHVQHEYGLFRRPGSDYDGVLGLVFFPVLWLATRVTGQSIVVTLHSVLRPDPEEASFAKRLHLLAMHELIARVADHLIFLSEDCEEDFHDDVAQSPDEYSVLPHGVNVRDSSDVEQSVARERFGFDPDDRIVAIPGFIRTPKGHDIFVEVAAELPETEFLMAGGARPKGFDAEYAEEIEAEAPPNVTITGVLDDEDFPVALATADLALLPYRVVSQSGTFNWCAAEELPVLASDRSYFERIEREWDALETVALGDVEEIASRVEALLDDPRQRAGLRRNIRRYREANSFESVAAEHARIYRALRADVPVHEPAPERSDLEAEEEPMLAACSAQREATATSD